MNKLLQNYRGSVAFAMSGPGPKPVFAPPGEGDGGDNKGGNDGNGNDGGDGGNGGGDGEGAGGAGKGGDKGGDGGSARQMGGLFGKRSGSGDGNSGDGNSGNGDGDGTAEAAKLPDKFLNKDKTTNVDALTKAYLDLEKSHGELRRSKGGLAGGEVPDNAAGYFGDGEIAVPKGAENFKGLGADDPGIKSWAEVCKEENIGKDTATRLMTKMLVKMNGHAPTPIDPDAEFEALGPNRQNIVDGLFTWTDGKAKSGEFSEEDVAVIESLMQTADGARFLVNMRNMTGEKPIPHDPGGGAKGMTMAQWKAEQAKAIAAKDYSRQEELDAMLDRMNPDGA